MPLMEQIKMFVKKKTDFKKLVFQLLCTFWELFKISYDCIDRLL